MNYKPVKYFFPSACGNCSLTWQRDRVRTGAWAWLRGKCVETGAVPPRQVATARSYIRTWYPRMEGTLMAMLEAKEMHRSFLAEQGGDSEPAGTGWALLGPHYTGRVGPSNTHTLGISSYCCFCGAGTVQRSQWHLLSVKLMWLKVTGTYMLPYLYTTGSDSTFAHTSLVLIQLL